LLPPPVGISEQQNKVWVRLGQFVVAVLVGLVFVLALKWGRKRHANRWWIVSSAALILSIAAFFVYQHLLQSWTCNYFDVKVVVGTTYTQPGQNYINRNPGIPCDTLVEDFLGRTEEIWENQTINRRRLILAGTYVACLPLFTICLIGVIQAIECVTYRPSEVDTPNET